MYEETTTTEEHEQQEGTEAADSSDAGTREYSHCYFEVAGELLAKPNILCDFIESEGHPATLIFCNSPSDADFIDVMLKKRGLSTKKLIGHVPGHRVEAALQQVASGEVSTLIVTDISAHGMDCRAIKLVINHSVPTDAQVYLDRLNNLRNLVSGCRVVSLVSPLDFGNFHYLKKIVQKDFQKLENLAGEVLLKKRIENMHHQAQRSPAQQDEKVCQFAALINDPGVLDDTARKELLVYLLHNTLSVLPTLSSAAPAQDFDENDDDRPPRRDDDRPRRADDRRHDDRRNDDRRGGGGRRDYRDRDGRDNRRSSGPRGRFREEPRQPQSGFDDGVDSEHSDAGRIPEFTAERQRAEGQRRMRAAEVRVDRDIRFYVGHGSKTGFSREELLRVLQSHFQESGGEFREEALKRFSLRELYSFVDVPEDMAASIEEKMSDATLPGGEKLYMTKTVSISSRNESQAEELEHEQEGSPHAEGDSEEMLDTDSEE